MNVRTGDLSFGWMPRSLFPFLGSIAPRFLFLLEHKPSKESISYGISAWGICTLRKQQVIFCYFFLCLDRRHGIFFASNTYFNRLSPLRQYEAIVIMILILPAVLISQNRILSQDSLHEIVQLSLCVLKSLLFENSFICNYNTPEKEPKKKTSL